MSELVIPAKPIMLSPKSCLRNLLVIPVSYSPIIVSPMFFINSREFWSFKVLCFYIFLMKADLSEASKRVEGLLPDPDDTCGYYYDYYYLGAYCISFSSFTISPSSLIECTIQLITVEANHIKWAHLSTISSLIFKNDNFDSNETLSKIINAEYRRLVKQPNQRVTRD